jgi:hypothetical protein
LPTRVSRTRGAEPAHAGGEGHLYAGVALKITPQEVMRAWAKE